VENYDTRYTAWNITEHVLSSSWDGRPFPRNRHAMVYGRRRKRRPLHDRLRHAPKSWAAAVPLSVGEGAVSICNTVSPWMRRTTIPSVILTHLAIWPQETPWFIRMQALPGSDVHKQQNWGAAVPLSARGAGSPSNTMWSGPRPTSVPSGMLIHPAIWPQQTWA